VAYNEPAAVEPWAPDDGAERVLTELSAKAEVPDLTDGAPTRAQTSLVDQGFTRGPTCRCVCASRRRTSR
jgi:hypothetical protein